MGIGIADCGAEQGRNGNAFRSGSGQTAPSPHSANHFGSFN
jgi:hypothetical protein